MPLYNNAVVGSGGMHIGFWWENQKERNRQEDLNMHGRDNINMDLKMDHTTDFSLNHTTAFLIWMSNVLNSL
jgi:hypothetical protein